MTTPGYGLLKRNPAMTREEFSEHWEKKHAPLVIPWALHYGIEYYAQASPIRKITHDLHVTKQTPQSPLSQNPVTQDLLTLSQVHNPRLAPNAPPLPDLAIEEYDGAAQMKMPSPETMAEAFKDPYYLSVILPDERRFLVSEAKLHIKVVPLGAIVGDKKVIIDGETAPVEDRETRAARLEALEVWKEMWAGRCG